MARPAQIQRLKHGKLLSGRVFKLFVETWNWLVGAFDNLRGDADLDPANGYIVIDRTDPDVPVIRFKPDRLPAAVAAAAVNLEGAFAPAEATGGGIKLVNCYYQVGGITHKLADWPVPSNATGIAALKISASSVGDADSSVPSVQVYATDAALLAAQEDEDYMIHPLYILADGAISTDIRNMPVFPEWEDLS